MVSGAGVSQPLKSVWKTDRQSPANPRTTSGITQPATGSEDAQRGNRNATGATGDLTGDYMRSSDLYQRMSEPVVSQVNGGDSVTQRALNMLLDRASG